MIVAQYAHIWSALGISHGKWPLPWQMQQQNRIAVAEKFCSKISHETFFHHASFLLHVIIRTINAKCSCKSPFQYTSMGKGIFLTEFFHDGKLPWQNLFVIVYFYHGKLLWENLFATPNILRAVS